MTPNGFGMGIRKNFKLLKYEHIIYSFEARNLEILNMGLLSRSILILRFYEHFKKFREICFARIFVKFKYLVKKFILRDLQITCFKMICNTFIF